MSRLVGLYPRAWQARYGEELQDLASSRPLGLRGSIDLVLGAIDAHRHPELVDRAIEAPVGEERVSRQRYADLVVAQRLGLGSGLGAVAWLGGWVIAMNGPLVGVGDEAYQDGSAALPVFFGSLVLLSAGLIGQMIRLPARARLARLGALLAGITAPIWGLNPWSAIVLFLLGGLVLLAVGAWWRNAWSGRAAAALLGSLGLGLAAMVLATPGDGRVAPSMDPMLLAVICFTGTWLVIAATLQSLPDVDDDRTADLEIAETSAA